MSNNIESLAESYAPELQELNDAAIALLIDVMLVGAEGVQLDGLGQIIGIDRAGLDDEQYRSQILAQRAVNTSSGTIEELLEIVTLALVTTDQDQLVLTESFPADFVIKNTLITPVGLGPIAAEAMYQGKAAGVHGVFNYFDTIPVFAFNGVGGSKFNGGFYLRSAIRNRGARESEVL